MDTNTPNGLIYKSYDCTRDETVYVLAVISDTGEDVYSCPRKGPYHNVVLTFHDKEKAEWFANYIFEHQFQKLLEKKNHGSSKSRD